MSKIEMCLIVLLTFLMSNCTKEHYPLEEIQTVIDKDTGYINFVSNNKFILDNHVVNLFKDLPCIDNNTDDSEIKNKRNIEINNRFSFVEKAIISNGYSINDTVISYIKKYRTNAIIKSSLKADNNFYISEQLAKDIGSWFEQIAYKIGYPLYPNESAGELCSILMEGAHQWGSFNFNMGIIGLRAYLNKNVSEMTDYDSYHFENLITDLYFIHRAIPMDYISGLPGSLKTSLPKYDLLSRHRIIANYYLLKDKDYDYIEGSNFMALQSDLDWELLVVDAFCLAMHPLVACVVSAPLLNILVYDDIVAYLNDTYFACGSSYGLMFKLDAYYTTTVEGITIINVRLEAVNLDEVFVESHKTFTFAL